MPSAPPPDLYSGVLHQGWDYFIYAHLLLSREPTLGKCWLLSKHLSSILFYLGHCNHTQRNWYLQASEDETEYREVSHPEGTINQVPSQLGSEVY